MFKSVVEMFFGNHNKKKISSKPKLRLKKFDYWIKLTWDVYEKRLWTAAVKLNHADPIGNDLGNSISYGPQLCHHEKIKHVGKNRRSLAAIKHWHCRFFKVQFKCFFFLMVQDESVTEVRAIDNKENDINCINSPQIKAASEKIFLAWKDIIS